MTIYCSGTGSLTTEQLELYSGRIAAYLQGRGARFAGIVCGKSPLVYAAIRACAMAHVCFIPIDEALPGQRRSVIAENADILLYDGTVFPGQPGWTDLRDVVLHPGTFQPLPEDDSAPAYRIYTSGSTGFPKGTQVSRGNLRSFLTWFSGIPAIAETKPRSVLNQAMFSFDLSVADLWYSLSTGARLTVMERGLLGDFSAMFRRMSESGAELAVFTPSFAELCMCDSGFCRELMPELRVIFFCGETLRPATAEKLFRRFPGVRIINAYGPTETCCAVTAAEITPEMARQPVLPIGDMRRTAGGIHIVDGEIVITGESVAGYTGGVTGGFGEYRGERCFHTGDGGEIRDGMLWFRGRLDRQLKIMGYRIEPEDIENNLLKLPGVTQALVSVSGKNRITAHVTANATTPEELRRGLSELVPEYMLPGRIVIVEQLPVSGSFKLRRDIGE